MLSVFSDEYFMKEALKEAQKAFDEDEVPVGAVVVCDNKIIARAHNMTEKLNDVTAHAEMLAITSATNYLGGKYLNECSLYVTLEPCVMCGGALYWSQIKKVVYASPDVKRGFSTLEKNILHPKTELVRGVLQQEASELITTFFKSKR
ncbi:MAG: nucleoside deaminase [Flavobacteriales bacterium]|jgi:tRNA(adenine34) deaminase|nr:MAG: nucleoside deaminase [Flavobacteriales bacterium]MBX2960288.1 nucleoside deaminase [Flavobacteriales bacterium]HRN41234.1 nucleoside deaminase [Vicingus sp.]HRP59212.1 nucleoside deaminase [Vicingus sp.]